MNPGLPPSHTQTASQTIPAQSGNDTVWKMRRQSPENSFSLRGVLFNLPHCKIASHREEFNIFL
jgi:hypothetical protein